MEEGRNCCFISIVIPDGNWSMDSQNIYIMVSFFHGIFDGDACTKIWIIGIAAFCCWRIPAIFVLHTGIHFFVSELFFDIPLKKNN